MQANNDTRKYNGGTITRRVIRKTVHIRGKGYQTRYVVRWEASINGKYLPSRSHGRLLRDAKAAIDRATR